MNIRKQNAQIRIQKFHQDRHVVPSLLESLEQNRRISRKEIWIRKFEISEEEPKKTMNCEENCKDLEPIYSEREKERGR